MTSASKGHSASTALELTVESIEDLVNAVVNARLLPDNANRHAVQHANDEIQSARAALSESLRDLTTPLLRVIEGRPQPYPDCKLEEDKPTCGKCQKQVPCKPTCRYWAAAVRRVVERATKQGTDS